ncbi:CLUMA_CG002191, isoform A [Clunio marinus]|uniref:CLUMA_CG002191, isoform A n=1 Tax=Clunio marinus TaxID=568069 RepID=A0A1J1HK56_9DIPT|nr:CLUMA_CG002191, isoform A [Clunio marinus]
MNESNFEQFFNSRRHESSTRSEMNFYDFENTSASTLGSASAHYQCNPYRTTIPKDNGICECMNNCHLTDSWMPYLKQENNFNCNTQLSNNIPILNSYAPTRQLIELQTTANVSPYPSIFYNNVDYTTRSLCVNPTSSFKARDQNYFQQHDFLQEDISRYGKLNYDTTSYHHYYNQPQINSQNSLTPNGTIKYEERTKTSIKFQDRNKKLDFKTSFREENCKVNGCFHHEETSSSVELTSDVFATPKKKWIRNYITGKH